MQFVFRGLESLRRRERRRVAGASHVFTVFDGAHATTQVSSGVWMVGGGRKNLRSTKTAQAETPSSSVLTENLLLQEPVSALSGCTECRFLGCAAFNAAIRAALVTDARGEVAMPPRWVLSADAGKDSTAGMRSHSPWWNKHHRRAASLRRSGWAPDCCQHVGCRFPVHYISKCLPTRHDRKQDTPSATTANTSQPESCHKHTQPKATAAEASRARQSEHH